MEQAQRLECLNMDACSSAAPCPPACSARQHPLWRRAAPPAGPAAAAAAAGPAGGQATEAHAAAGRRRATAGAGTGAARAVLDALGPPLSVCARVPSFERRDFICPRLPSRALPQSRSHLFCSVPLPDPTSPPHPSLPAPTWLAAAGTPPGIAPPRATAVLRCAGAPCDASGAKGLLPGMNLLPAGAEWFSSCVGVLAKAGNAMPGNATQRCAGRRFADLTRRPAVLPCILLLLLLSLACSAASGAASPPESPARVTSSPPPPPPPPAHASGA